MGVDWIPKCELAQKVNPGEENYLTAAVGTQTLDLLIMGLAL